jgi:hypothetical protein
LTFAEVKQKRTWIGACSTNEQGKETAHMKTTAAAAVAAALAAGAAWAGPGEMDSANEPALWVQDASKAAGCSAKMCFKAGAATTVQAEGKGSVPRFSRAALVAAGGKATGSTSLAWNIELSAQLKRAALGGNTLFVFFDMADPNSIKHNESTALFQAPVKGGKSLAVRLNLTGEDGFRAGHTYRVRIAQLIGGHEVVLSEGDFSLL